MRNALRSAKMASLGIPEWELRNEGGIEVSDADRSYWGNRLEVPVDAVVELASCDDTLAAWAAQLGPRFRALIADELGLPTNASSKALLEALRGNRKTFFTALLVHAVISQKRQSVLLDVAGPRLTNEELA